MTTSEAVALHSVIQRTFSGNSSEAEIHLQIFLVSAFLFLGRHYLFCKGKKTEDLKRVGRADIYY